MRHHIKPIFLVFLLFFIIIAVAWYQLFYLSKYSFSISRYTVSLQIQKSIRIVQLSDLHGSQFGSNNQKLVDSVKRENPDLIFLTGDLINDDTPDISVALNLITNLSKIAPVYASYGNHELDYQNNFHKNVAQLYSQAGATVLEQEWQEVEINGSPLRIGGIYSYCLSFRYANEKAQWQEEANFLASFQSTTLPTLLLSHLPVGWLDSSLDDWAINVIFSGHLHGGQVILPGIGGLYAPDMGWFPGRLWGTFSSSNGQNTLVLSRGLGAAEAFPRLNNVPEIVVVDLLPRGA